MSEIRKEKVFAYNWVGEALYFVIFREEGNVLSAVRTDGRLEEEVRLPRVYDNVYDMIAVLENGKTRVAVGVGKGDCSPCTLTCGMAACPVNPSGAKSYAMPAFFGQKVFSI